MLSTIIRLVVILYFFASYHSIDAQTWNYWIAPLVFVWLALEAWVWELLRE